MRLYPFVCRLALKRCFSNPFSLLLLFFLLFNTVSAQQLEWVQHFGVDSNTAQTGGVMNDMVTDEAGNVYITGTYLDTMAIGGSKIPGCQGVQSFYLARFNSDGKLIWFKSSPCNRMGISFGEGLAIGPGGKLYVGGAGSGIFQIGNQILGDTINPVLWVARFDTSGQFHWVQSMTRSFTTFPKVFNITALTTDPGGNLIVSGDYDWDITFPNGTTFFTQNFKQSFVAKFDVTGNCTWAIACTGASEVYTFDLETDGFGNIYVSGISYDGFRIGFQNLSTGHSRYLCKLRPNGSPDWLVDHSTLYIFFKNKITVDRAGNTYMLGVYQWPVQIDTSFLISNGGYDLYLCKYDPTGQLVFLKPFGSVQHDLGQDIILLNDSLLAISGFYSDSLSLDAFRFPAAGPTSYFIATADTAGNFKWVDYHPRSLYTTRGEEMLGTDQKGNIYFGGHQFVDTARIDTFTFIRANQNFMILGKYAQCRNTIQARAFRDWNSNLVQDSGETDFENLQVQLQPGNHFFLTDSLGRILTCPDSGSYTLSIANPPRYFSVHPSQHSAVFNGCFETDSNNVFALQPDSNAKDLKVLVTYRTPVRKSRAVLTQVDFGNVGTVDQAAVLKVLPGPKFVRRTVSPVPDTLFGDTLVWYFIPLKTGPMSSHLITLDLHTSSLIGDTFRVDAWITPSNPDSFPADNHAYAEALFVEEPPVNEKTVSRERLTTVQMVNGEWLEYKIRFQNTGTDTAWVVRVRDTLSNLLDWNTFQLVTASHPYSFSRNNGNQLEWVFNNISLPGVWTNEPASHGFVRFRVKALKTLKDKDEILNSAGIYMDYFAPAHTNYVVTEIEEVKVIRQGGQLRVAPPFRLFPNPGSGQFKVSTSVAGDGPVRAWISSLDGRVLRQWLWMTDKGPFLRELQVRELPQGIYLFYFQQGDQISSRKIMLK